MAINNVSEVRLFGGVNQTLTDALTYVTAEGKCEQSNTPSPSNPAPIVCNNGTIEVVDDLILPTEYEQLSYIQGDGTAYLDLGIVLTQDDNVQITFTSTASSSTSIFGYRNSATSNNVMLFYGGTQNNLFEDFNNSNYADYRVSYMATAGTTYVATINKTARTLATTNGTIVASNTTVNNDSILTGNVYLFAAGGSPAGANKFTGHVYEVIIEGRMHLIPAKRKADNVLGMYNILDTNPSTAFLTNAAGSGSFIAGSTVHNYKPVVNGVQEVLTDSIGNTVVCDNLFAVGTYKDTQEVINGQTTKNTGIYIVTGDEDIGKSTVYQGSFFIRNVVTDWNTVNNGPTYCSHFSSVTSDVDYSQNKCMILNNAFNMWWANSSTPTVENFIQWLKTQYNNGTPVIVVYPLATATTRASSKSGLLRAPVIVTSGSLNDLVVNTSTGTRVIQRGTYANCPTITDVDCMHTPWVNNDMSYGFAYSNNLTSVVNIHNDVTNASYAFRSCTGLRQIPILPSHCTQLLRTFEYCTGLTTVNTLPYYATELGGCFAECTNLTNVVIPSFVNSLYDTFRGCVNLVNLPAIPNSVTNLYQTFAGTGITNASCVNIPNTVTDMTLTFGGCKNLTEIPVIPDSVITLDRCFANCDGLDPNLSYTFPNKIRNFGQTFQTCYSLVNARGLVFSNEIQDLGVGFYSTFQYCRNLVTAPNIPASATSMVNTFADCRNLAGDIYVYSHNIQNATNAVTGISWANTSADVCVNIHIPASGATYMSFIQAGYTTNASAGVKKGNALLITDMP